MVNIKEINENLNKLKTNIERISYLENLLKEIKDKKFEEEIKKLIQDLRELEEIGQIETKGRVEWSLPEEIPEERRTLERQVISTPLMKEEKKEENKITYGLQDNTDFYRGKKIDNSNSGYKPTYTRMDQGKPFIEGNEGSMERRINEQFTGNLKNEDMDEPQKYRSNIDESRGYSSLSEELHEKEKKKLRF